MLPTVCQEEESRDHEACEYEHGESSSFETGAQEFSGISRNIA